jgi:flagellar M-ring protein FliF
MATLPAEVSGAGLPVEAGGVPLGRTGILRGEFVSGLGALPAVRQVGLLVGIAASIALGVALVLWLQAPEYRPITGGFDTYDDQRVTELLDQNSIKYRIDPGSGIVLVDTARYDAARIALAQADLLGSAAAQGGAVAEPPPFGSSQQAETNRFLRALEAELSRSIGTVQSIRRARRDAARHGVRARPARALRLGRGGAAARS